MEILQTKRGESFGVLLATMCDTANTSVSAEWPVYPTRRVSSFPVSMDDCEISDADIWIELAATMDRGSASFP